jgi:hypothetical protein
MVSLLLVSVSLLEGCSDEGSTLSKAVLASAGTLNFEATGTSEKIITVYADAEWVTEVPEWVTVTPTSGTGTMDITISVTENMRGGAVDNPRKAAVVFKGSTLASRAEVIISQEGDKYRDCQEYTLTELAALTDETIVSVPQVTVTVVTTKGFVVSDGTVNIFMQNSSAVSVGDNVSVRGTKLSDTHLPYVECDEANVNSTGGTVTYPIATDITDRVDTYTSTSRAFITVSGILNGNNVTVEGANYSVAVTDAPESLGIASLNGHKVKVTGYFAGVAAPIVKMIAATVEDQGIVEVIYFVDDFEWLQPWAVAGKAGQTIETDDSGAAAPQIYAAGTTYDGKTASEALSERGYGLVETPGAAIYLQKNYLKFGKTDYQAGLIIPAIDAIPAGTKLKLTFDWAPMVGGTRKFDPVKVIVYVYEGANVVFESNPIGHSFVDTVDKLAWLHAEVTIEGINFSGETRISVRSDGWGTTGSVYKRWFLDNIKLVKAN